MRTLFYTVILAALGWSGWWWVGSAAKEAAIEGWLAERRDAGWLAQHDSLSVAGYPNRFDTRISGLELADPHSGWAWFAPAFQILALSYQPNHVIAVWPGSQTIATPGEDVSITSDMLRGSVVFEPDTQLALDRTTIEIRNLALAGESGWTAALASGLLSTRQTPDGLAPGYSHDINFAASALRLPSEIKDAFDPTGLLPLVLSQASLDLTAAFTAPWDRTAIEGEKPDLTALNLKNLTVTWGNLDLRARGLIEVDADGYPAGKIDLTAKNWRDMLRLAVSAGVVRPDFAGTIESGLELIARLSGDPDVLNVPLTYADRQVWLGPIPLGDAIRLN